MADKLLKKRPISTFVEDGALHMDVEIECNDGETDEQAVARFHRQMEEKSPAPSSQKSGHGRAASK